jgi:hypothetical protein
VIDQVSVADGGMSHDLLATDGDQGDHGHAALPVQLRVQRRYLHL